MLKRKCGFDYLASCRKLEENSRFGNKNVEILLGGD